MTRRIMRPAPATGASPPARDRLYGVTRFVCNAAL
jgi:hypothetical protein